MRKTRTMTGCPVCPPPPGERPGAAPSAWMLMLSGAGFLALIALAALSVMAMTTLVSTAQADTTVTAPSPERQRELVRMVRQECGFCHGLRLTGGLGSPLTATRMREKPAETLEAVIRHGIPGTAMPGWAPFLSEPETRWIVQNLRQGFPDDK